VKKSDRDGINVVARMYLDVVEAGFEVVRGNGRATRGWFGCKAI
jgi:hypothetical protein